MTFFVFSVFPAPDSPLSDGLGSQKIPCSRNEDHVRYKYTLILTFLHKTPEGLVCHGEDMRFRIFSALTFVHLNILIGIDW